MKETGLKRILLYSSTFVIVTIISVVSYFLIVIEKRNFKLEMQKTEKELIDNKKKYFENRLKMIMSEITFDQSLINKFQLQKVEYLVESMAKTLSLVDKKNSDNIRDLLSKYNINDMINCFAFKSDGTLIWNQNNPKSEGNNYFDFEDMYGYNYVEIMIKRAKSQNLIPINYTWYLPNKSIISNNTAFVRYVPKHDIIVGAYISKESIEKLIKETIINKLSQRKLNDESFLYVDYLKSYNMSKNFSLNILNIGNKDAFNSIRDEEPQKKISSLFLDNSFYGIQSTNIDYKDEHYLVYTAIINRYRWIISVGENLEELYKTINYKRELSENNLKSKIVNLVILSIIIAILFFVASIFLVKKIEDILLNYQKRVDIESDKYQALYTHSNDSFLLANDDYKIIDSNPKASDLISLEKDDLINKSFKDFFPKIDFDDIRLQKSGYLRTTFIDYLKNEKTVEFTFVWINIENEKILFASIRDITERMRLISENKEHEQILIQQSKMAAMGEMIGNIAHQWRQPLSQISGLFMDISSAYSYKELDEKYIDKITNEADDIIEYMTHTIDDFRNFFNPNKTKENFLASEALSQAVNIIKSSFNFYEIGIDIKVENEKPIFGYPNEYSQVLLNILSNSKDIFILREIKNPKITIDINYKNGKTNMIIKDNAGGIKKEILSRIFEPYFTTKFNYGTGIGLYMSKIIIEKNMNGFISAENIKNGAKFTISV